MKNIIVCVDFTQSCVETLKRLPSEIDLRDVRVHFIHVFETPIYNFEMTPYSFPLPEDILATEKTALETLKRTSTDLDINPENVVTKCFFSYSRTEKIKEYLDETNADLVVLATRGRHGIMGLFSSSLADFLCKFSPCDIFVLRP